MAVNVRKSSCTHIGPRFTAHCCCVTTLNGAALAWTDCQVPMRVYLGSSQVLLLTLQYQNIILSGRQFFFVK